MSNQFLKISGDHSDWNIYRKSVIICDVTEMFINRALPHGSRTIDQMCQAARSCKQNIVEGVSDRHNVGENAEKIEAEFIAEGGIKEAMSRARRESRGY